MNEKKTGDNSDKLRSKASLSLGNDVVTTATNSDSLHLNSSQLWLHRRHKQYVAHGKRALKFSYFAL